MTNYWDQIKQKIVNENGIISVGFADVLGAGIASVFWLYIASVIEPGEFGEIHYFLAIAARSKGTIMTKVINNDGLNNKYNKPIENIIIHNSFLNKICILTLKNINQLI